MLRRRPVVGVALLCALIFSLTFLNQQWSRSSRLQPHALKHTSPVPTEVDANPVPQGPARGDSTTYIFAFGDSYTTYGFESEGAVPTVQNPQGNRATEETVPDQPATYTPKWLDYVINDLSPPRTLTFNYARGASTIDAGLVPPRFWGAKAFTDQGKEFMETVGNPNHKMHMDWDGQNSAFVVWFGINDVANTAEDEGIDYTSFYRRVVTSYLGVLSTWYAAGARRFVVLSLPPLDRTPSLLTMGPPSTFLLAKAVSVYNEILANDTLLWKEAHAQASIQYLDTQPVYHKILDASPSDATCTTQNKTSCMWVDMFHPSVKLQEGVAVEVERLVRGDGLWA